MSFAVFLLGRELGALPGAAFIAGIAAGFAAGRYGHVSHLNLSTLCWLPLALWALLVFVRTKRRRYVVLFGVTLAIQLLASLHMAVLATAALGLILPFVIWHQRERLVRQDWIAAGLAIVVPYLLLAPTLLPHLRVGELYGFERDRDDVQTLAAGISNYLSVFPTNHIWGGILDTRSDAFFPGAIALIGAALAVLAWRRWPVQYALLLTIVGAIFSFGLWLEIAGHRLPMPWALVYDGFPPIRAIRGVARFGLLTAIGVPLLAAFGYSAAWRRLGPRFGQRAATAGLAFTVALSLLTAVELRSGVNAYRVPPDPPFVAWLQDHPDGPVLELPADGLITRWTTLENGIFQPIRSMYLSTHHWHPVVAGYSSFVPEPHYALLALLSDNEGDLSAVGSRQIGVVQDLGIRWIVIHHRDDYDWQQALVLAQTLPELRLAGEPEGATVFEVLPAERQPLTLDEIRITLPETFGVGLPLLATLLIDNPNPNPALLRTIPPPDLHLVWRDAGGGVVLRDQAETAIPLAANPLESSVIVPVAAPDQVGQYQVEMWLDDHPATRITQQIEITRVAVVDEPAARLVQIDWDAASARPGATIMIDVTWKILRPLGADFASTVQLLDVAGERRAAYDLIPGGYDPPSSTWQVGDSVTLHYPLVIPADLPSGDYQLLTAIYAWQGDYPRLPIVRSDGTTGGEEIASPFVVK
ncbi:MAG: hypothetical protein M9890_14770 [Thermomicrobiales bacterium]|nr:hypothetical protein [Thermomicrobiales bacterium]